jgi:hypothetical protein
MHNFGYPSDDSSHGVAWMATLMPTLTAQLSRWAIAMVLGTAIGVFGGLVVLNAYVFSDPVNVSYSHTALCEEHDDGNQPQVCHEIPKDYVYPKDSVVNIMFRYSRARGCSTNAVQRGLWTFAVNPDGEKIERLVTLGDAPASTTRAGKDMVAIFTFTLPKEVQAGTWFYRSISHDDCGFFRSLLGPIIHETDNVPIVVK